MGIVLVFVLTPTNVSPDGLTTSVASVAFGAAAWLFWDSVRPSGSVIETMPPVR